MVNKRKERKCPKISGGGGEHKIPRIRFLFYFKSQTRKSKLTTETNLLKIKIQSKNTNK